MDRGLRGGRSLSYSQDSGDSRDISGMDIVLGQRLQRRTSPECEHPSAIPRIGVSKAGVKDTLDTENQVKMRDYMRGSSHDGGNKTQGPI